MVLASVNYLVNQIKCPKFNPEYVCVKFGLELEPYAFELISDPNTRLRMTDFEQKITELISMDFDSMDGYMGNFILNSPYYYDHSTGMYFSSVSSLYENLLHRSNYKFPQFLCVLYNEFNFSHVIHNLLQKYALASIEIHNNFSKKRPGYTFHNCTSYQIKIITQEAYQIYCRVQNFLNNLSTNQKKFIEITEQIYDEYIYQYKKTKLHTSSTKIFSKAVQVYVENYDSSPPNIDFSLI